MLKSFLLNTPLSVYRGEGERDKLGWGYYHKLALASRKGELSAGN